jgi:UDPglucose 6-dehydrogenase
MNVCVYGLWHLGTVTAACLAESGHQVVGLDADFQVTEGLQKGRPPIFEPGLEDLVREGLANGCLSFTTDASAALSQADLVWVAFDTPVDGEDQADVNFVLSSLEAIFPYLKEGSLIIISSQLPVGTTSQLEMRLREKRPGISFSFAYLPENLRLGKAIEVFNHPDRVVAGVRREKDKKRIARLLHPFSDNIIWMSVESAELTKHAINSFLATSVAFINELSGICEHYGANVSEVEKGLKSDHRIGQQAYLRPGEAFAGGTLARDLKYLIRLGQDKELPTPLFSGVAESNELHKKWARRKLKEVLKTFKGKRVAILGLTYKPGTNTLRRSEAVETARWLNERGAEVVAYDPAVKILPDALANVIHLYKGPGEALRGAHAVLIGTPWPEFKKLEAEEVVSLMVLPAVIDPGGFLFEIFENRHGIVYVAIGGAG